VPQQLISALIALLLLVAVPAQPSAQLSTPSSQQSTMTATTAATPATIGRFRVKVTTTSTQVKVLFNTGEILGQRVISLTGGATVVPAARGWTVKAPGGQTASMELLGVYREKSGVPQITIDASRGTSGGGSVTITNEAGSGAQPFTVARLVLNQQTASTTLSRSAVLGASDPVLPRADARRLVLAFYYPWWSRAAYDQQTLSDKPADPRSTNSDFGDVLSMTQQASAHGINGFIVSWTGDGGVHARGFDLVLAAAEQTGSVATVSVPISNLANDGVTVTRSMVKQRIVEALRRKSSKAFLRKDGVPVVFIYQMRMIKQQDWRWILDTLSNEGNPVKLIGDAIGLDYAGVNWGIYQYVPNRFDRQELEEFNVTRHLTLKLLRNNPADRAFLATVSPGYDVRKTRPEDPLYVERGENGERYALTWDAGLASQPDWIVVTSWNEWFEGTHVEPSVTYGDRALLQTKDYAALFKQ
jgi:hypothetical protein